MEVESTELRQETEHLRQHLKIEMQNREAYLEETALGHREEIQKLKDHHMTEIQKLEDHHMAKRKELNDQYNADERS